MSIETRLLLIRHGQPRREVRDRCYGGLDVGLSRQGLRQANLLAHALDGVAIDALYTSPLTRAIDTAAPLAAGRGLTPIIDDALRELDFGEFEGRSYDEIARSAPDLFRVWMETPTLFHFPGGESYRLLRSRAIAALHTIRRRHSGGAAAIVSHSGVLRAMLADCLAMPDETVFRIDQSYCGLSVVDWVDETPIVRLVNSQVTTAVGERFGFLPLFRRPTRKGIAP